MAAIGHCSDERTFIEELIPIPLWDRGKKTATFGMELHEYTLRELDVINQNLAACADACLNGDAPLAFLGYIHSHPGELSATMSLPDLELHALLNENSISPCLTGIINPQQRDLCVYWDSLYAPSNVVLLANKDAIAKWM